MPVYYDKGRIKNSALNLAKAEIELNDKTSFRKSITLGRLPSMNRLS